MMTETERLALDVTSKWDNADPFAAARALGRIRSGEITPEEIINNLQPKLEARMAAIASDTEEIRARLRKWAEANKP